MKTEMKPVYCTVDTSFFAAENYSAAICEQKLREAICGAKNKADACRKIMALDAGGYLHLRLLTDAQKAQLVNPFAAQGYVFTGQDFAKARNRQR